MNDSIGSRIKQHRASKKMTQQELGDKLNISKQAISQYERDSRKPSLNMLDKIANALEITRNALLTIKRSYRPDVSLEMVYDLFEEVFNHSRVKEEIGLNAKKFIENDKYFIFQIREEFIQSIILNSRFSKQKILNDDNSPLENPLKICPYSNKIYELGNKLNDAEYLRYMRDKYDRLLAAVEDYNYNNHKTLEEEAKNTKGKYDDQGENDYRYATQEDINNNF